MAMSRNYASRLNSRGINSFPKIIIWLIYGAITAVIAFPLYRFMRNQDQKNREQKAKLDEERKESAVKDPAIQTKEATTITAKTNLHSIAKNIAHHLGFIYPWYDPRRWSENDEEVYTELKKCKNKAELELVKQLYYSVYAVGRNMQDDCRTVLDSEYYNKINW